MKLIFATMHFHRHNNGGGGIGKLAPLIENKHKPHVNSNLDIYNKYIKYNDIKFKRIWPQAYTRKRSSRMKSY